MVEELDNRWKVGDLGNGRKYAYYVYRDVRTAGRINRITLLRSDGKPCRFTRGGAGHRANILNEAANVAPLVRAKVIAQAGIDEGQE